MAVLLTVFGVVVALLAVLVAGLLRSHAEILRSLNDLGVSLDPDADADAHDDAATATATASLGLTVPRTPTASKTAVDVVGVTPRGDALNIAIAGASHPTLLAFLTSGCTTCLDFWNTFANPDGVQVPGDARLVVVTKGEESESPARVSKFATPGTIVVMSSEAWGDYDVPVAPYFVYVDGPSGRIVGEGAAATWGNLVGMMEQAVTDAGLGARRGRGARPRLDGRAREARVDRDLLAAGIEPGHPSLYPVNESDLHDRGR